MAAFRAVTLAREPSEIAGMSAAAVSVREVLGRAALLWLRDA